MRYSTWEPRPDNTGPNHVMPDASAVHQAFAARPVSSGGSDDPRWDRWLRQRVDGQFTGRTDEIFQWAACKWGLPDDVLRAIAVRESTWYEYETYASGRPVLDWGMGDMMPTGTSGASVYCAGIAAYGRDYQYDFGTGICPRTFSIAGVMSWQAPSWGQLPGNQNGTFPFTRRSTAFALDYLASQLRGCYNGWEYWLKDDGKYAAGDLWGCVGPGTRATGTARTRTATSRACATSCPTSPGCRPTGRASSRHAIGPTAARWAVASSRSRPYRAATGDEATATKTRQTDEAA